MKRVKQIFIFLLILSLCGGYAFWRSGLHLSPEAAMHAEERGLRYGPSEEILLTYEKENGSQVLVGRWEKGLSVVCVEPQWGRFWKVERGQDVHTSCLPLGQDVEAFLLDENRIVGLSLLPEVTEVTCYLNVRREEVHKNMFAQEITIDVAENGFFHQKVELPEGEDWGYYSIGYLEGRTESGEVVFQDGEKRKLAMYPDGEGYRICRLET